MEIQNYDRWLSETRKKTMAAIWEGLESGSPPIVIFCAKATLGLTDKIETEAEESFQMVVRASDGTQTKKPITNEQISQE